MRIIDITLPLSPATPTYKGKKKKPEIILSRSIEQGANETLLSFESHTGTHVDAPFHMIAEGKTIDQYPLEQFEGKAYVAEIRNTGVITEEHLAFLKDLPVFKTYVLLKTDNSFGDLNRESFTYLSESGAIFLTRLAVKGVGIDALGIERNQPGHPTHRILLSQDRLIYEGLALSSITPGWYQFQAYPLFILKGDGSPVRAVLWEIQP
ncbi:MAG TPA: cyclase family protein [Atribacteraceae bacterium]|nr:cyclase family protein [Atribacteraceae bacterium]